MEVLFSILLSNKDHHSLFKRQKYFNLNQLNCFEIPNTKYISADYSYVSVRVGELSISVLFSALLSIFLKCKVVHPDAAIQSTQSDIEYFM